MDITINTQKSATIHAYNRLRDVYLNRTHHIRVYMYQHPNIATIITSIAIIATICVLHITLLAALTYMVIYTARKLNHTCAPANKFLFFRRAPTGWSMQCSPLGVGIMIQVVYAQQHTHITLDFLREHHRVSTPFTLNIVKS